MDKMPIRRRFYIFWPVVALAYLLVWLYPSWIEEVEVTWPDSPPDKIYLDKGRHWIFQPPTHTIIDPEFLAQLPDDVAKMADYGLSLQVYPIRVNNIFQILFLSFIVWVILYCLRNPYRKKK